MADRAVSIKIVGLDQINKKLKSVLPAIQAGIKASTLHVKGKIAVYPPTTSANSSSQDRWYERGWGSKWRLKGGGWHGIKSSEMLGRKWTTKVTNNGMTGIVGNNVTYGPYVQGPDRQASALKRIGWKTTEQVAEEEKETVTDLIKQQVDAALMKG